MEFAEKGATSSLLTRRLVLGGLVLAGLSYGEAISRKLRSNPSVVPDFGEMLMLGFAGTTPQARGPRLLASHVAAGRVGGVVFEKVNIGSRQDVAGLVRLFASAAPRPLLIAIDHEGGSVQRLTRKHGFTPIPPARKVAETLSTDEARGIYAKAGAELAEIGFNLNLGPVVDVDRPGNSMIGSFGRTFSSDPATVAAYAKAFVEGFASAGIGWRSAPAKAKAR